MFVSFRMKQPSAKAKPDILVEGFAWELGLVTMPNKKERVNFFQGRVTRGAEERMDRHGIDNNSLRGALGRKPARGRGHLHEWIDRGAL